MAVCEYDPPVGLSTHSGIVEADDLPPVVSAKGQRFVGAIYA